MISHLVILATVVLSLAAGPAAAAKNPRLWELKQAVTATPQDPQAHYNLGLKYESLGKTKQAVAEYNQVLKLKPNDGKALYSLARALGALGETGQAIDTLKQAVKLNPKSIEARNLLAAEYNRQGTGLLEQGNLDAAREALEAGLQVKGAPAETEALRNNLGCLYVRENHLDQAAETFREVLRQNPNAAQARYNLALLNYTQGDYQAASRQLFALKGIDPGLAGELSDYRFKIRTSTDWQPPVKTMLTFPGSPLLIKGHIPSDFEE
ncbi:MAG: tetratricopeptide repeat protein [Syntrophobacterales bacterium]|jgi:tetratricopeptide (TPR) repeat protein|nr:tetratricopeptide repeat protein [Syntrophobacterales bacterium]